MSKDMRAQKSPEKLGDRREIAPESPASQRLKLAEDVLEMEVGKLNQLEFVNKVNEPEFKKIDVHESAEKQKSLLYALAGTSMFELIPQLLRSGIPLEQIKSLEIFQTPPAKLGTLLSVANGQGALDLQAAFGKIQEILSSDKKAKSVRSIWEKSWKVMAEKGAQAYEKMLPVLSATSPKKMELPEKGQKGFIQEKWDWAKENPGQALAIGTGLALGVYLAKKAWDWLIEKDEDKDKNEKKKSGGFFGKLFKKATLGAGLLIGAGIGLGRLTETEKVTSWLKTLGWNDSKIIKAVQLFSHFEFTKAWETVTTASEQEKFVEETQQRIKAEMHKEVSEKMLSSLGKMSYQEFMSLPKQMKESFGKLSAFVSEKSGIPMQNVLAFLGLTNSEEAQQQIDTLRMFLEQHQSELGTLSSISSATVEDALRVVLKKNLIPGSTTDQTDMADQNHIDTKYTGQKTEIALLRKEVVGNKEERDKEKAGLDELTQRMRKANQDPSVLTEKYDQLNQRRQEFSQLLAAGASAAELEEKAEEVRSTGEELVQMGQKKTSEMQAIYPTWAPLPYFWYRYQKLGSRTREVVKEDLKRATQVPLKVAERVVPDLRLKKIEQELGGLVGKTLSTEQAAYRSSLEMEKELLLLRRTPGVAAEKLLEKEQLYLWRKMRHQAERLKELQAELKSTARSTPQEARNIIQRFREAQEERNLIREGLEGHIKEVTRLSKEKGALVDHLVTRVDDLTMEFRGLAQSEVKWYNKLFSFFKKKGMEREMKEVKYLFKDFIKSENKSWLTKIMPHSGKARLLVLGLTIVPGVIGTYKDKKEREPHPEIAGLVKEMGLETLQLVVDVLPFTSELSDFYTVWSGQEVISKRKVQGWNRYSRAIWGVVGTVLDAAMLIPVVDIVGAPVNLGTRLARAGIRGAEATKIIKLWPRIKEVAASVGGWRKFMELLKEYRSAEKGVEKAKLGLRMGEVVGKRAIPAIILGEVGIKAFYTPSPEGTPSAEEVDPELLSEIENPEATEQIEQPIMP